MAVSYMEFLDPAWPLVKPKSSFKEVGQDVGTEGGVQSGFVGQAE